MAELNTSNAFPFLPILTLIFITLKLVGYIDWSWGWVLSPILIPVGLVVVGYILVAIFLPFYNKEKK